LLDSFNQFRSKNLELNICLNVPLTDSVADESLISTDKAVEDKVKFCRNMVKTSESTFIHLQTEFIDWILNLPQLRHDVLRLYKINIKEYEEDADEQNVCADYLQLIKHTLNSQLNKGDEDVNPLKIISTITFKGHLGSTR